MRNEGVTLAWKHLWLTVHRLLSAPRATPQHGRNWLAQRVRTLVEAAPGERWTLKDAARFMGYAPNYFAELFKRESGLSFHRFLMEVRVRAAEEALGRGAQNITEIALTLGFSSSQHFSRVFAEKTGVAPSQWPKRLASAHGCSRKSGKRNSGPGSEDCAPKTEFSAIAGS
jgi:AraC-like DNA-binding protein